MLEISELYIYPIKSLGGIKLDKAIVTDRGFEYDRRWMLIDVNNRFISQREVAAMALLKVSIKANALLVTNTANNTSINIPLIPIKQILIEVTVWDDTCSAQLVNNEANEWFSNALGINCRLVYMPDDTKRHTDPEYTSGEGLTSLSDGYPFMMIGQSSLDDLNKRLDRSLLMNRFRPNMVFTGGQPFQEDIMDNFTINNITFNGVKLCARCKIITIDQFDGTIGKEPLKTLASYRARNNKIFFGQNLVHQGTGIISVGDKLIVSSTHTATRFIIN